VIPRILHHVWLGPNPPSALSRRCQKSWRNHLPDWKQRLWDEENAPLDHPYTRQMIRRGLWAFASDVIRLQALLDDGGLYLDTDVELLRPPPGDIVEYPGLSIGLLSLQNRLSKCSIGTSWISAPPGCPLIRKVLDAYRGLDRAVMNNTLFTRVLLPLFSERDFPPGGEFDYLEAGGIRLYHPDFFNPVEQGERGQVHPMPKPRSVAVHHALADWGGSADPLPWWRRWIDLRIDRKILRPIEFCIKRIYRPNHRPDLP